MGDPSLPRVPLLLLPPNRVRRNYRGGASLDALAGVAEPRDGDRPEDWIASTTRATNPGLPAIADEGLARVSVTDRSSLPLIDLFAAAPEFYLGSNHVARLGTQLGFLAKLLDSSIRLHVQAHPTADFARRHLGSRWGKLETYVILGARPGVEPYIRLGFQRPPTPAEWRRIVLEQDIAAMDACFDRVPLRVGEVWLVPGGLPHAIGEGVLMLEVMEPTDLVVRCEFEREGIVVPPAGRFMGRDPDFALGIFDYTELPVAEVRRRYRIEAKRVESGWAAGGGSGVADPRRSSSAEDPSPCPLPGVPGRGEKTLDQLIGPEHTDCFTILRYTADGPAALAGADRLRIGVVESGSGTLTVGECQIPLRRGAKFLLAAAAPVGRLEPADGPLRILFVSPGDQR
jgi:mannose-6-phosphate isomerase